MHARKTLLARFIPHVALVLIYLGISVIASRAQTFSSPVDIVQSGGSFLTPLIAVDSSGNIDLAWFRTKPNQGVFFARSTDGGKTFSHPVMISSNFANMPAQIIVDGSGDINLVWQGTDPSGITTYFFSRSTDGGASFSTAMNLTTQGPNLVANFGTQLNMAVDNSGNLNFVWSQYDRRGGDVLFSRSTDGGATFSTPVSVGGFVDYSERPQIAFGSQGDIYVFWSEGTERNGSKPWFARSADGGSTFSTPEQLNTNACCGELVVDSDGGINILASPVLFRSTDRGLTFSIVNSAAPPPALTGPGPSLIAASRNADLDILSLEAVTCSNCGELDLYFTQSSDHGATFSAPAIIERLQNYYNFRIQYRFMLVDARGNINVVWEDSSAYGQCCSQYDILFSRSSDAGKTFLPAPMRISNAPAGSHSTSVALDSAGSVYAVWADAASNDLFFSRDVVTGSDFTISAAPASQSELPGGSAKLNVTLTSTGGFSNAVDLSCGKLPSGAQCAFDSTSVTPTGSGAQTTLTVTTPPTIAAGNFTATITATSGSISHTQDVQVTVGGLSGSVLPSSAAISVSSSGNFAVSVASSGGFTGQVSLACGGLASGLTCSFNPSQVTLAPNGSATSTLTVVSLPSRRFPWPRPQSRIPQGRSQVICPR